MTAPLPVIGAALTVDTLARLRNWVFDAERDLELQDFYDPAALDGDWAETVARYRPLLAGHRGRVGIHGPFYGLAIDAVDRELVGVVRRRFLQGLEVCAAVGGTHMVVHSPYTTWDHNNMDGRPGMRAAKIAQTVDNLEPVVRRAEALGVVLAIENIEDIDPLDRVRLAEAFASPSVQVSIDTGHALYAHGSNGAPPPDYFVRAAGSMLAHVHLQDADGYADRHWAPGEGDVNWRALFRALGEIDARPRLLLELADHTRIVAAADWLAAQGLAA